MKSTRAVAVSIRIGALVIVGLLLLGGLATPLDTDGPLGDHLGDGSIIDETAEYIDWGIPIIIDGRLYIENGTDFYANPGWLTNNANDYYWSESDGYYSAKWVGGSEEYAIAPMKISNESRQVRIEFDIQPTSLEVDSDLPMVLMAEDREYLAADSIQFYFSRNSTSNMTALEAYDSTGAYTGATRSDGFTVNNWYHITMAVDYDAQTAMVHVYITNTSTELYNLTISDIGEFNGLPRVGFTSVGVTGGVATGCLDNFTLGTDYSGSRELKPQISLNAYKRGEGIDIDVFYGTEVLAWTELPAAPVKRESFASAWNDEERFLIINGGRDTIPYPPYTLSSQTWIFYADNQTWVRMKDSPNTYFCQGATWHAKAKRMIVYGGYDGNHLKETWAFDPYNNTWTQLADGFDTLQNAQLVYYPEKELVLLCGGWNFNWQKYCWAYNYSDDTWTRLSDMPASRTAHTAIWDDKNERMIVYGGEEGYLNWPKKLWAYYPVNDTWIVLAPGPYPMQFGASVWDPENEILYTIPGMEGISTVKFPGDFNVYNSDNNTWSTIGGLPIPNRFKHCAYWDSKDHRIIVFGGSYAEVRSGNWAGYVYNDTWSYGKTAFGKAGMDLTLEVRNPSNESIAFWVERTNLTGWARFNISLPKDAELGTYNCTIVSELDDNVTFTFNVTDKAMGGKLHIVSVEIEGDFDSNGRVNATVVVENPAEFDQRGLLVFQVMNPKDEPIPPVELTFDIDASNTSTYYLNVTLPPKTRTGTYHLQVILLDALPSIGGRLFDYMDDSFEVT